MRKTPRGLRLHIGIFGRRNVGKSSLLNVLTRQAVSIVSDVAGTTTDPVEKPMELLPIGPVIFIDTAGIDDVGVMGEMRTQRTRQVFNRTDIAILVAAAGAWNQFEEGILNEFQEREIPVIVVFNKTDIAPLDRQRVADLREKGIAVITTIATQARGILNLREALIRNAPAEVINTPSIMGDLIRPGDMIILVVPIDMEAPKGRLILPQVQTIRDILDNDACCMVVKERELQDAFSRLNSPPKLVVTDSQAFMKVSNDTPPDVPLTSFSILFARFKGDLHEYVQGALQIDRLKPGDNVLIAEACTHHPIADDIGTVKIPRWLNQYVGGKLNFRHVQGRDYPENIGNYQLIIHCGACMLNRREVLSRILIAKKAGVPVTNYGLTIAYSLGLFKRALSPFPAVREFYKELKSKNFITESSTTKSC